METIIITIHVLGAGIMVTAPIFALVFFLKKQLTPETISFLRTSYQLLPFIAGSQLITGILLFLKEPDEFKGNPLFWLKMILYVADGLFATFVLERKVKEAQLKKGSAVQNNRLAAFFIINLLILTAIITIGVSIAH